MAAGRPTPSNERSVVEQTAGNTLMRQSVAESTNMAPGSDEALNIAKQLHRLVARLVAGTELHPLLDEVLDAIIELQHADFGNLQLYNPETKALEIAAQRGFHQEFLDHFRSVEDPSSICGRAMLTGQRVIVEDVQADPNFKPHREIAAAAGFRAVQSTPLFSRDSTLLGMISTHFRQPHRPSERDLELTDLYVGIAAEMIQRRQAEERLRKSEERFHLLFNQMLVGCTLNEIVCDEHGNPIDRVYLEANPAFERLMGLRREDVIGKRMSEVLSEAEPFWIERYGRVALTGEPMRFEGYMRAVDKHFDVSVFSPQRGQFGVTFIDISGMKTMEADLRSLLSISAMLNATLDIDSLLDSLIVESIRLTKAEGGCAGLRTRDGMACHRYFQGSEPVPFEYCWPAGVGWPGWVLTHKVPYLTNDAANDPVIVPELRERFRIKCGIVTPLIDANDKVIGFFKVNNKIDRTGFIRHDLEKITAVSRIASVALENAMAYRELSEKEASLRELWNRLLQAQDEERRRIGRELHDAIGQVLTALSMRLGVARRKLGVNKSKTEEALTESLTLVRECSDSVRTLAYLLHSPVLEEGGLEAALRPYVEGFSQRSGIQVELEIPDGEERLPRDVEEALFRVVQESLTNIHLYSEASNASISVHRRPDEVAVKVRDDGRGIPPEILEKIHAGGVMPGVGIASMDERLRQLGGWLDIDSSSRGTVVTARVPLKVEKQ